MVAIGVGIELALLPGDMAASHQNWLIAGHIVTGLGVLGLLLAITLTLLGARKKAREIAANPLVVDLEGDHIRFSHHGLFSGVRIHVRNQSQKTIRKVRVEFERCTQQYVYKVLLERMNKEPNPFSLDPDADAYMDLVYLEAGGKDYVLAYKMDLLPPGTGCRIQVQPLELVVSVGAKDTAKTLHSFGVWVEPNGELRITKY